MAAITNSSTDYSFLNKTKAEDKAKNDVGQLGLDDFMSLMTTQLQNQDPLKPMDNNQMLAQIASFAQVTGIADLQSSFSNFASSMQSNQALQGSSLVGKTVLFPSSVGYMTAADGMKGQVNVAEKVTDMKVTVYDEAGKKVRTIEMGTASGFTPFTWDGLDENGEALPEGAYQFKASGTVDGTNTAFATGIEARVSSVSISSDDGLYLNIEGIGSVAFKEVVEIT
ncbi:MAG TPA: flagellar hook assembly protein FlgD [Methylophaga aminisulfidivorans]|uniref:Basal-body rod modification protein FlgD n=1 Tax=Methylophaga aminisulfidivorans TaxID=230105 RepID=A0A7C2AI40_9GAMM|nr:flagellar hook assembly protein FlgD [Methylophaga aminisulfidivorans]